MQDQVNRSQSRPTLLLTLSMIIFGTIGICRRFIPVPSDTIAFARGITGGVFLLLILKVRGHRFAADRIQKKDFLLLVISGALIGFNWILLFEAYKYTTVAVATLCYYMQPTIVMLLSPLILREKLTVRQLICMTVSFIGMVLVSGVGTSGSPGNIKGVALGLGAAALYATVVLLNKRLTGIPVFEKTIIQLLSAAAAMIPYMAATGSLHTYTLSPSEIALFLTVGIVHTGIAYALYFGSIERLPARTCALMSYIDPVTAEILSALFLREPIGISGIAGAVLIIGSAIYSEL